MLIFLFMALAGIAGWQLLGKGLVFAEVRERRRRRRNYQRVVSRRNGPGVRLAVTVPSA
jgi:hypothetical protein